MSRSRSPSPAAVVRHPQLREKLSGGSDHAGSASPLLQRANAGRMVELDRRWHCLPRLGLGALALIAANAITGIATRSAFSGAANERGALQDRMHDWIGFCDQAGQSTTLGSCPAFWQPITNMLPDKLVLIAMLLTVAMYMWGARRQRDVRVCTRLLAETCFLWATLLVLRAAVVAVTIMPAPSPLCRNATEWAQGPGGRPTTGWFLTPIGIHRQKMKFRWNTCGSYPRIFVHFCAFSTGNQVTNFLG
jgi:hypothetical protein